MNPQMEYNPANYAPADCLVLKLCEYEEDTHELDNTMYVIYDKNWGHYIVRGKRNSTAKTHFETYSFNCENLKSLFEFITFVICKKNIWSYSMHNCSDLPILSDNITYELLDETTYKANEIAGYDNRLYNKSMIMKCLKMLKNVFNYY